MTDRYYRYRDHIHKYRMVLKNSHIARVYCKGRITRQQLALEWIQLDTLTEDGPLECWVRTGDIMFLELRKIFGKDDKPVYPDRD